MHAMIAAADTPQRTRLDQPWFVRPAREDDLTQLLALAELAGNGFTALPSEPDRMQQRLKRHTASIEASGDHANGLYVLVLEHAQTGQIGGTASVMARAGGGRPLHSLRVGRKRRWGAGTCLSSEVTELSVARDLEGASEVGGLFLHPAARARGLSRLLARSRYLFIAAHGSRFNARVVSQLRGRLTRSGDSPFWSGLGERFCGFDFHEAERIRAAWGTAAIAELFPEYPICADVIDDAARAAIGVTHDEGGGAMRLLLSEGFRVGGTIDLLEGGPNVTAATAQLRAVRDRREIGLAKRACDAPLLTSSGEGSAFRACFASGSLTDGAASINPVLATILRREPEQRCHAVPA